MFQTDRLNNTYTNQDNQPAQGGTTGTLYTPNGPVTATIIDGIMQPNK